MLACVAQAFPALGWKSDRLGLQDAHLGPSTAKGLTTWHSDKTFGPSHHRLGRFQGASGGAGLRGGSSKRLPQAIQTIGAAERISVQQ